MFVLSETSEKLPIQLFLYVSTGDVMLFHCLLKCVKVILEVMHIVSFTFDRARVIRHLSASMNLVYHDRGPVLWSLKSGVDGHK